MVSNLGRHALAAAFTLLAAATAAEASAQLLLDPDGATAWLLNSHGRVIHVGIEPAEEIPPALAGSQSPPITDIALSPDGRTVYGLIASPEGRTSSVLALRVPGREEAGHWEVRGSGRFLVATGDGTHLCVVGLKPSAARRGGRSAGHDESNDDDWILSVVDPRSGKVAGPLVVGLRPLSVALQGGVTSEQRLFLGGKDRIISFTLDPPKSSWFYTSPGDNVAVSGTESSPILYVLRETALVLIDPSRRVREEGRVQLSDDDATTVIPLASPARGLALSSDGSVAVVLHEDAASLTVVDARSGKAIETRPLPGQRDLMAGRIVTGRGAVGQVVLASSSAASVEVVSLSVSWPVTAPAPAAPAPVEPEPASAPSLRPELPQPPLETPAAPEPASQESPAPATPEPSPRMEPEAQSSPPAPAQQAAPRPSEAGALTGRISGEVSAAKDVLLYGPDNILKLRARAPIGADGSFSFPLPPPGTYRVVVTAGPGAYVFTRPAYRTIVVAPGGIGMGGMGGMEGIDFEVRGKL